MRMVLAFGRAPLLDLRLTRLDAGLLLLAYLLAARLLPRHLLFVQLSALRLCRLRVALDRRALLRIRERGV
jgi:hypothetical protein